MNELKFTKGPWKWRKENGDYYLSPGILVTNSTDATPFGDSIDKANAALIESAPVLYDELQKALDKWICLANSGDAGFWDPEKEDDVIRIRSVLASARGGGS